MIFFLELLELIAYRTSAPQFDFVLGGAKPKKVSTSRVLVASEVLTAQCLQSTAVRKSSGYLKSEWLSVTSTDETSKCNEVRGSEARDVDDGTEIISSGTLQRARSATSKCSIPGMSRLLCTAGGSVHLLISQTPSKPLKLKGPYR